MNTRDLMQQLTDLNKEYEKTAKRIGKPAFVELSQKCFDACPELGAIVWTQYAPHFNDGEACTFSVHEAGFWSTEAVDENGEDGLNSYDDDLGCYGDKKDLPTKKARKEFENFETFITSTLGEDLCERVFGEDAKVTILRNGTIDIGDCDHD